MARSKKPRAEPDREQYRKAHTPVRIKGVIAEVAKQAAAELAHDLAQYVNDAVRMRLASEGRWPPLPPPARPRG